MKTRMNSPKHRRGITLIELMITMLISLVILLAMVRAFRIASSQMASGRATIEMAGQLRSAGELLRTDLENITVPLRPVALETQADGYFEYIEGPDTDAFEIVAGVFEPIAAGMNVPAISGASYLGDHDDILAMTIRSETQPFQGRWVNPVSGLSETVESYVAEVIWWIKHYDIDPDGGGPLFPDGEVQYSENLTLLRRVLLIRPDLTSAYASNDIASYYRDNDVSIRPARTGIFIAPVMTNSLADLTRRENRFSHNGNVDPGFPHSFIPGVLSARALQGERQGEDVMLTGVSAFDVKVFSPNAEIQQAAEQVISPADPGFDNNFLVSGTVTRNEGAYVDLGYNIAIAPLPLPFSSAVLFPSNAWFSGAPDINSQLNTAAGLQSIGFTWCTWSPHYEYDGVNQDSGDDAIIDQGADGVDNDNRNGTDDDGERETKPPYPHPIRSLQITFRLIEKGTGQSRQLTVRQSFVPE